VNSAGISDPSYMPHPRKTSTMAFPTTKMPAYVDLKVRVSLALSRCQEAPWLDFKESQPWEILRWRLLKTIMGMANLRDGGLIVVGVAEKGNAWSLTGIAPEHLVTFDYDSIIDQLGKYASPQVRVDVVTHDHEDGNRYLAFHVHQFDDSPVICRHNSSDTVKPKDRLTAGDVYVRPGAGKPQTATVTDAAQLRDLLELAAESRARKIVETAKRLGLVPAETAAAQFDEELAPIARGPVPIEESPHWHVMFRPEAYESNRIPTLTDCVRLVQKARVQLRGWDFPHMASETSMNNGFVRGSHWIGSSANFMGNIEYWRLFQSGQFTHFALVREAVSPEWRAKLKQDTMNHLGRGFDIDWDSIPGFISLTNLIYTVTEYFEFAARVCQAGVYRGGLDVSLEVNGINGFVLTTDFSRLWSEFRRATDASFSNRWRLSSDQLVAASADCSRNAIMWLCECFGWISPNADSIRKDQERLLSGNM